MVKMDPEHVTIIQIRVTQGPSGMYFASSPDMAALSVAARSIEELAKEIPEVIRALYAADGVTVEVYPTDGTERLPDWAQIPPSMAARAIDRACA